MRVEEALILIGAGFFVGIINTLAGGGTIISFTVLMMMGLPAPVANGTNRIAIALQTFTASWSFKQQKVLDTKRAFMLSLPTIIGSILGAWIAIDLDEKMFEKALAVVMLFMLVFMFYKPQKWIKGEVALRNKKISVGQIFLFFIIGVYGGFIHVGVGYFLLAALVMNAGYDLVSANAAKVFNVFLYTLFALAVFIYEDKVNFIYGLVMAIGNVAGALFASRFAVERGAGFVRWVVVVLILFSSLQLLGIIDIKEVVAGLMYNSKPA